MSVTTACHPGLESVRVTLHNADLWREFHQYGTEMIITKTGRRMFPYLRLQVSGLDPYARYFIMVELSSASNSRYKFSGSEWTPVGSAEPQLPPSARLYIHPDSPATGAHWTGQHVLLNKIKLTNNTLDRSGNIVLNSMHKYLPRVHVVMATDVLAVHWSPRTTFEFPETEFMAVTAYQNEQVTKLKIDNNPFAKGFRDVGVSRCKKRKAEQPKEPEKIKKETPDVAQSASTDDSGVSSIGSPTPPVTTSPVTSFSDCYSPPLPMRFIMPEYPPYFHPPVWPYPYFLPPPPPPLYPSPYFPYLVPPTYQAPSEPFLIDLSVKRESVTITEQ
ncbi:T-box-containing protein TBX6L-like [Homalodisca vitripennis]|uniref:T-box-containing protein TBX6L-like n=1 Tax=Homalodisca vitripennis TaxID=197043 RepID=UPI001EEBD29D|nr:T-box-containing protein TBX6L-like [Homalodisca vitripennis]XP_046679717.1 T-box-containing protein TBX6L-like [Homalodisca vitripennis]